METSNQFSTLPAQTVPGYRTERARVKACLRARVSQVQQFGRRHARLRLLVWACWVQANQDYRKVARMLSRRLGRPYSFRAVRYHIRAMRLDGTLPRELKETLEGGNL